MGLDAQWANHYIGIKMFKIISFISLLFVVQTSLAECASTGCSEVSIDKLYVTTSGVVYINTSGDEKLLDC